MFYAVYSGILNWDINAEENPYMGTTLRPKGAQYMKGQGFRKLYERVGRYGVSVCKIMLLNRLQKNFMAVKKSRNFSS